VLDGIAAAGLRSVAVDFPCFGRSGGELTVSETSVPRLSVWLLRFLEALGQRGPVMVAGYDIGGGVAVKRKERMGCKLVGTVRGTKLWAGDC